MRKPIIAGNWKMHKTSSEVSSFIFETLENISATNSDVIICAPFIHLSKLVELTKNTIIKVGAQNMHYEENGAFTGEVSGEMLKDIGVEYVIIGHSERRQYYNETDESVNLKTKKALSLSLVPIVCVGETENEKEKNETEKVVKNQIELGLRGISANDISKVVIAYEPIWAIGTGKVATSKDANFVISYIRKIIKNIYGAETADSVRIQYGGSVKPNNIKEFLMESDIDGALVGGASLKPADFIGLL